MPEQPTTAKGTAQVPFRTIAHLFDADDPTPEDHRELSDRAEERIFRSVLDPPAKSQKKLCDRIDVMLPATDLTPGRDASIVSAIRAHFRSRSDEVQRNTRLTQKVGLREIWLTIAICIPSFAGIAICSQFKGDPLFEVIYNVLVIFCWVTIWQPFQSLVFDRWTLSKRAQVYRQIAEMDISVRAA